MVINYYNVLYDERFNHENIEDFIEYIVDNDKYQELLDILNTIELTTTDINMIYLKSDLLYKLEGAQASYEYVNQGLSHYPNDGKLLEYKLSVLFELDNVDELRNTASKQLELGVENVSAYNVKSRESYDLGLHDQALVFLNKALEIDPDYPPSRLGMSVVHEANGEYEQAINHIEVLIKFDDDLKYLLYRAKLLSLASKNEEAETQYKEILMKYPDDYTVMTNYSTFLNDLNRIEDSIHLISSMYLDKLDNLDEVKPVLLSELSIKYEKIGDIENAMHYARIAFSKDPINGYISTPYMALLLNNNFLDEFNEVLAEMDSLDISEIIKKPSEKITLNDVVNVLTIKLHTDKPDEALIYLNKFSDYGLKDMASLMNVSSNEVKCDLYSMVYYKYLFDSKDPLTNEDFTYYLSKYMELTYNEDNIDSDKAKMERMVGLLFYMTTEKNIERMENLIESVRKYDEDSFWIQPYEIAITYIKTGNENVLFDLTDDLREVTQAIIEVLKEES